MDDIEHYGNGLSDLPPILGSFALGSEASGVGFAWSKFSAFASDWDSALPAIQDPRIHQNGATVTSWDIWAGGLQHYTLPRSQVDHVDTLLGKRGTVADRHTLAAQDLVTKLEAVRHRLACKCCSWDEGRAMIQWILGGSLGYAPLVGLPSPATLHQEDAALHRLLLSSLGTRVTAERMSLSASRSSGGLGVPLLSEMLVASTAADLLLLLNGKSSASLVSRDTLRQALRSSPHTLPNFAGLLLSALNLLAGYGIYISLSTDRFVARMLDNLRPPPPHPLVGRFKPDVFDAAARYCRVGVLANSVRLAWVSLVERRIPMDSWHDAEVWAEFLPAHSPVTAASCASAAAAALAQSNLDWRTECSLFGLEVVPDISENWPQLAWEDPWDLACNPRARALLTPLPHASDTSDSAIYGDGGFSKDGATFACQARGFGSVGQYWECSAWVSRQIQGKLPTRYGWESSTIHTAELLSLAVSLRFRRADNWHLLVFDRSALFDSLRTASAGSLSKLLSAPSLHLVSLLKYGLDDLRHAWAAQATPPSWRLHQLAFPQHWNVRMPLNDKMRTFSRIAFVEDGVVGLDIRSHQQYTTLPFPVFTQGNEAQDAGCRVASANPSPPDVRYPSSGPFAWAALDGRMVTGPIRPCIRHILRAQSIEAWRSRPVQGLLPRLLDQVFTPTLDVSIYTQCNFTTAWSRWLLPADSSPLDLSAMACRLHRAIGGSWTERLHAHATEATVASQWAARVDDPSHRTCPLCRQAPGTPRHVVMGCTALAPLVNLLRDDMERDLAAIAGSSHLLEAARRWQTSVQRRGGEHPPSPPPSVVERWPILAAWRWLVPIPAREALLSQDVAGSSAASANKECGTDLAYRGVLPKALGVAICHLSPASLEDLELEQFASLRNSRALQSEIQALARRQRPFLPAAQCCQRLVVGLRFIRSAYHARVSVWLRLAEATLPRPPPQALPDGVEDNPAPAAAGSLSSWLGSATGTAFIQELRWALLPQHAATQRLRRTAPCRHLRDATLTQLLLDNGGAFLTAGQASWGAQRPSWSAALAGLALTCRCPPVEHQDQALACWHCGGVSLPVHTRPALPCPWCRGSNGPSCASCNVVIHFRGRCRWNCGAHRAYDTSALSNIPFCPDCWQTWAHSLAAAPRRADAAPVSDRLLLHLRGMAAACTPGAGSGQVHSTPLPTRRVRRWLLRRLSSEGHAPLSLLLQELRQLAQGVAEDWPPVVLSRAVRALQNEGLAVVNVDSLELLRPA